MSSSKGTPEGIYTIFCFLSDPINSKKLGKELKRTYVFSVQIGPRQRGDKSNSNGSFGGWEPPVVRPETKPMGDDQPYIFVPEFLPKIYATIREISPNVLLTIQFTENLRPVNATKIDDSVLDIYINSDIRGVYSPPSGDSEERNKEINFNLRDLRNLKDVLVPDDDSIVVPSNDTEKYAQ